MKSAYQITSYVLFLLLPTMLFGQNELNYVPNPQLEGGAPNSSGQIGSELGDICIPWTHAGWNSVDYCNSEGTPDYSVPSNIWGNQNARSGNGYAHLFVIPLDHRLEYLQVPLHCTLTKDVTYEVSFYASLTDNSKYAIDRLGAEFSDTLLQQPPNNGGIFHGDSVDVLNENLTVLKDKSIWMNIKNTYVASGDEKYLTIGCFNLKSELEIDTIDGTRLYSSYYIEDVSVIPISKVFDIGNDTTVCRGYPVHIGIDSIESCNQIEYSWNNGAYGAAQTVYEEGEYILTADFGFGVVTDTILIISKPSPEITLPKDTLLCPNSSIYLDAGNYFETYEWSTGENDQVINISEGGTYSVEVLDAIGCLLKDTVIVEQANYPLVNLGSDTSFCIDELFVIRTSEEINNYDELLWNDLTDNDSLIVEDAGIYWLTISNICDSKTDSISLIKYNCELFLMVPNAFRPGSATNSIFKAEGANIGNFSMHIYNRWGALVFTSNDIQRGWDGIDQNNKECPQSVYTYIIQYEASEAEFSIEDGGIKKRNCITDKIVDHCKLIIKMIF